MNREQKALWREVGGHPRPSGTQTLEQATNLLVDNFRAACQFEGIAVPDESEVRAAIAAQRSGA